MTCAAAMGSNAPINAPAAGTSRRMISSGFIVSILMSVHEDQEEIAARPSSMAAP